MRYKIISPKYVFYLGLLVRFLATLFLGYLFVESRSGEIVATVLLGFGSSVAMLFLLRYVGKYIHGTIDTSRNVFQYGGLLFDQEVPLNEVTVVGKVVLSKRTLKLRIKNRTFYIYTIDNEAENSFRVA